MPVRKSYTPLQYGMKGGEFAVATIEGNESRKAKGFLDPGAGVAFGVGGDKTHPYELTQTSSNIVAWYLCHFLGCEVVRKTHVPKSGLFGRVSYTTHWWLHY